MGAVTKVKIGDAVVDFAALSIAGPNGSSSVEPKVMNLLQVLVDNAGAVVTRAELLDQVWSENFGGDESLSRGISLLRRAFCETRGGHQYIETVPKRGYRLVATISTEESQDTPVKEPAGTSQAPRTGENFFLRQWPVIVAAIVIAGILLGLNLSGFLSKQDLAPYKAKSTGVSSQDGDGVSPELSSIAVLPFEDLSGENDQQYLADGLAEEVINALVKFPELRVIGRTSSFAYRNKKPDLESIRSTLGVAHVLTGSLRKQGDQVRVTARLVRTADGHNVWSENYDGDLSDIFDLQEDIAKEITGNLGVILDLSSDRKLLTKLTDNRDAYVLFIQGRAQARKFGHRNKASAKQLLEQAIVLDPAFAAAWAWLAQAEIYLTLTSTVSEARGQVEAARFATERALLLEPSLAMGHYVSSILHEYDLDFSASADALEKAYELNSAQPFLAIRRGHLRGILGRSTQAATLIEQGLSLDPTDTIGLLNLGFAREAIGQYESAKTLYSRSRDLGFEPAAATLCNLLYEVLPSESATACWNNLSEGVKSRYGPVLSQQPLWSLLGKAAFTNDQALKNRALRAIDKYSQQADAKSTSYILLLYLTLGAPERFMAAYMNRPFALNGGVLGSIWSDAKTSRELRQHKEFPAFAERIGLVRAWQKYGWPDKCQKVEGSDGSNGQFVCS